MKIVQSSARGLDNLLGSPEVAALSDAANKIALGNLEKGSLAWRLAPPYSYARYLVDTHSKRFWQHGQEMFEDGSTLVD